MNIVILVKFDGIDVTFGVRAYDVQSDDINKKAINVLFLNPFPQEVNKFYNFFEKFEYYCKNEIISKLDLTLCQGNSLKYYKTLKIVDDKACKVKAVYGHKDLGFFEVIFEYKI